MFQSLIQHLAPEQVNVEWFMLDYEAGKNNLYFFLKYDDKLNIVSKIN